LGVGDTVEVFDGHGFAVSATVVRVENKGVELIAVGPPRADQPPPCSLTIASAVPKGERFDWLVEKTTELGVERLVPILSERSIVEPGDAKLDRLRRSVIEASKQCGRNRLMVIDTPRQFDAFLDHTTIDLRLIGDPTGLDPARWPPLAQCRSVTLAVGPEGGWSDSERARASRAGWIPIALGAHILRIETAAIALSAAIMARIAPYH
jgi:16S rRNA (uracil1498-N3)-methyltransferase